MNPTIYKQIYEIIRLIPSGKVATYGQISEIVGYCTARMVGYAVSSIPLSSVIPWQRVINYKGEISLRSSGSGGELVQQNYWNQKVLNLISRVEPILNNIAGKASNSIICFSKLV